ncbi:MAG TPA: YCF48-related protein [Myxococcota bacterium]|nr:YCF48-related protein [Myxococcota bacterium]
MCALALVWTARADVPPELAQAMEVTRAKFPKLVHWNEADKNDQFMVGTDDAELETLKKRVGSGPFDESVEAAVWVVLEGFARQQGPAQTFGRNLTSEIAGLAATSGNAPALQGVGRVLEKFLADESHPFSILAQGLLAEKIRCGAASLGLNDFVAQITKETNPDREYGFASTDGTVADRFGIHPHADLYSIAASGPHVVAVGYFGSALVSSDAGETWSAPATGTDEPLYAVAFGPGDEVWAAGRAGVTLHSKDGGRSWLRRPTPFARHIFGLYATEKDSVLAVGDYGLQLRTTDGGGRWLCIPRAQDVILGRLVRAGAADAVGVGEFGTIERLKNLEPPGARGVLNGVPEDTYVYDAWLDADGKTGVAVGLAGTILRSSDSGATWSPVKTQFSHDLFGVGGFGSHVVVSGEAGLLAYSTDGGLSFAASEAPALPVPLLDVEFGDADHAYAVGPRGLILRSTDGGAHFSIVHSGIPTAKKSAEAKPDAGSHS